VEEVVIRALASFGLRARRAKGLPGVWVGGSDVVGSSSDAAADPAAGARKIASVGMSCSKWYTSHGLALNVEPDLEAFSRIVPCGVRGEGVMTSMAREGAARAADMGRVKEALLSAFEEVFECELRRETPGSSPLAAEGLDEEEEGEVGEGEGIGEAAPR
jgi:lipoyl(octanoyl) transferase